MTRRRDRRLPPPPSESGSSRSPLSPLWMLAIGILLGRWMVALPLAATQTLDVLLYLAIAFLAARSYRRWARARLEERAEQRERSAGGHHDDGPGGNA